MFTLRKTWCQSILKELKSYALIEFDIELVQKAIRYMGYIAYKFEKSYEICVECLIEILDCSQETSISEAICVSRDVMRKYKGKSLDLLKKINSDLCKLVVDPEAKSALLYILGEFSSKIKDSTSLIKTFVETFNEENDSVKCQILNAVVKNFVNKPDETEEIVKECLQKGGKEAENPDVRDRAYIYWRLLENDPDLAKDIIMGEKPAFEYLEQSNISPELADDIIENMTNISAVYHQSAKDTILKEDMIEDLDAENDMKNNDEKTEEKPKENSVKINTKINVMDQNLLGLDEEENNDHNVTEKNNNIINQMNIFEIFGNDNNTQNKINQSNDLDNIFNLSNNNNSTTSNTFEFEFGGTSSNSKDSDTINDLCPILDNNYLPILSISAESGSSNGTKGVTIYSDFGRKNNNVCLGLVIKNNSSTKISTAKIFIKPNSFGIYSDGSEISLDIQINSKSTAIVPLLVSQDKSNGIPPTERYELTVGLVLNTGNYEIKIPFLIHTLFTTDGKISNQNDFVTFYKANKQGMLPFKLNKPKQIITGETALTKVLEQSNIYFVCKNSKGDPTLYYYSFSVLGKMTIIIEVSFDKNSLNLGVLSNNTIFQTLVKESLTKLLSE